MGQTSGRRVLTGEGENGLGQTRERRVLTGEGKRVVWVTLGKDVYGLVREREWFGSH